eukprot:TRINITY_DN73249_c0_g1_i1.p1 TRINITY_DN73249_c0_g1~~TRINITY_DN73249_c0_g1_i1.p1  ORF type:complete len:224 (-),score=34.68 TRINITY_DN73249_c0_g1_i1:15-686(-)
MLSRGCSSLAMSSSRGLLTVALRPVLTGGCAPFLSAKTIEDLHSYHAHLTEVVNAHQAAVPETRAVRLIHALQADKTESGIRTLQAACQWWNIAFFLRQLRAEAADLPTEPKLAAAATEKRAAEVGLPWAELRDEFEATALAHLGSGFVWVVWRPREQKFRVSATQNSDTPLLQGDVPVLALDMWEHARLNDYGEDRQSFVSNFSRCIDWDFVKSIVALRNKA